MFVLSVYVYSHLAGSTRGPLCPHADEPLTVVSYLLNI